MLGRCAQGYEAAAAKTSNAAIIRQLGSYLLPKGNAEYKARIGTALVLLVASKGLNVSVRPLTSARNNPERQEHLCLLEC